MAEKTDNTDRLATAFETLAAQMLANAPKPQLDFGSPEYQQQLKDKGYYRQFARPLYQGAFLSPAEGLSEDIVDKVNHLKSGKYLNGRVQVIADEKRVQLRYPMSTADDRMENTQHWRTFEELINLITAEAAMSPASA